MKQLEFPKTRGWGGKRRGAGRPNRTGRVSHGKRPRVSARYPLHLSIRVRPGVASLRSWKLFKAFNKAITLVRPFGLEVNHFSLLDSHLHLIVEVRDNTSLARGMKSLLGRLAKAIRAETSSGFGAVFAGRFHMHILKTPQEVKNALEYVLLNQAKHARRIGDLDRYSSAQYFEGWKKLLGGRAEPLLRDQLRTLRRDAGFVIGLSPPRSWLGRLGWTLAC